MTVAWTDEAQTISEESLQILLPTIREPGSYFIFTANPRSSADAFSQRFLKDKMSHLRTDRVVEDEMSTTIMVNWDANVYLPKELDQERLNDKKNLPAELYLHVWEGEHYDSVDDALVDPMWFDAALEAEEKFKYRPSGAVVLGFDPADTGPDAAGLAIRHGAKVLELALKHDGDVRRQRSIGRLITSSGSTARTMYTTATVLALVWRVRLSALWLLETYALRAFVAEQAPENPSGMYNGFKTNRDAYFNRRSQAYWHVRERFWKTYQAMEGEFIDPDELIFLPKDHALIRRACVGDMQDTTGAEPER